ncbi:hypothetical protein TWF696_007928 [Orbilia brochopaga]|uniref:MACPF-like domain-containing protein n=1 Tax=Orbilia brochopaga TaxID=3140254 RepID=A0AAV9UQ07_9PEZI
MTATQFHIAVQSTDDTIYPSFPNTTFATSGKPSEITLKMIRSKCRISSKLFFTSDGKTRLDEATTLEYYMSLVPEGQAILKLFKQPPKVDEKKTAKVDGEKNSKVDGETPSKVDEKSSKTDEKESSTTEEEKPSKADGEKPDAKASGSKDPKNTEGEEESQDETAEEEADSEISSDIEVKMLKVQVTDGKTKTTTEKERKLISGVDQSDFRKFLERARDPSLTPGKLPTFDESHRKLASLETDWATNVTSKEYTEPADLTEQQWDRVLTNNRALHGYYFDGKKSAIVKAPRRAFKIRSNRPKAAKTGNGQTDGDADADQPLPTIPPFYVCDDAEISITEITHNFQKTMLKEGFNSVSIEGNATFKIPVSVSGAWDQEQATANQEKTETAVKALAATYNFPRVGVELDSDSLELTDECKEDIYRITDQDGADRFYRKYGTIFATSFTLGGFLYSTRDITTEEHSTLAQVKNKTRLAAGISIQSPYGGGGGNYAKTNADGTTGGNASLHQDVRLAWNARGGDTLLCSNPPAWAATVKDYRLWRLMNQQRCVGIQFLIQDIDTHAFKQLTNPKPVDITGKKDITKNEAYSDRLMAGLLEALRKPDENIIAQKIARLYAENVDNLDAYNNFGEVLMKDPNSKIPSGTDWNTLSSGRKAMFGLWLYHVDKLERPAA